MTSPQIADVVVVGSGITGCAIALRLAGAGKRVSVLDSGRPGSEASGRNAGTLHFQLQHAVVEHLSLSIAANPVATRLLRTAAPAWSRLAEDVAGDLELSTTGGLMVAETADDATRLEHKHLIEAALGVGTEILDGRSARSRWPQLGPTVRAASYCPSEGHAHPHRVTKALLDAGADQGVHYSFDCALVSIDPTPDRGYIILTTCETWQAEVVVIAAGVASAGIAHRLNWQIGVCPSPLQVAVLEPGPSCLPLTVQHVGERLSLKQLASGHVLIGGGWPAQCSGAHEQPLVRYDSMVANIDVAVRIWPELAQLRLLRAWTGTTPTTIDGLPQIEISTRYPGLYAVFGGNGFTHAPAIAEWFVDELLQSRHLA